MDNLVEEINNIIQNKQECQTMEYDIQFICCSCKITEIERKHIIRELRKKHMYDSMEPVARKRFLEDIKRKYSTMDGKQCICNTCHSKVIKGKLPCQAVVNNMYVDEIPTKLSSLEKLQQIQIALEKIVVMYKGQQRKIKGAICNVPVEYDQTCNQLPHLPDRSCIIILELKRKLQSRGHVYF